MSPKFFSSTLVIFTVGDTKLVSTLKNWWWAKEVKINYWTFECQWIVRRTGRDLNSKENQTYLNHQRNRAHQIDYKPWILKHFFVAHLVAHLAAHLLTHLGQTFSIVSSRSRALNNKYNWFVAEHFKSTSQALLATKTSLTGF